MLVHIRLMNFPDPADAEEAVRQFSALRDKIDVIREMGVGRDVLDSEASWDFGFYMKFDSEEDLRTYQNHPAHDAAAAFARSKHSARAALDFHES